MDTQGIGAPETLDGYRLGAQRRAHGLIGFLLELCALALIATLGICLAGAAIRPAGILLRRADCTWLAICYALTVGAAVLYCTICRRQPLAALWRRPARGDSGTNADAKLLGLLRLAIRLLVAAGLVALLV